jgi:hypothetical protein
LYTTGVLSATLRGDWNRHGQVTAADIPAMLAALTDLANYKSINALTGAHLAAIGDFDGDGAIMNRDIQGPLNLVASSGSGSVDAVAEPAPIVLVALAVPTVVVMAGCRRIRRSRLSA